MSKILVQDFPLNIKIINSLFSAKSEMWLFTPTACVGLEHFTCSIGLVIIILDGVARTADCSPVPTSSPWAHAGPCLLSWVELCPPKYVEVMIPSTCDCDFIGKQQLGGMWPQAKDCWEPRSWRSRRDPRPRAFRGVRPCQHPDFRSWLQSWDRINVCVPMCGGFLTGAPGNESACLSVLPLVASVKRW